MSNLTAEESKPCTGYLLCSLPNSTAGWVDRSSRFSSSRVLHRQLFLLLSQSACSPGSLSSWEQPKMVGTVGEKKWPVQISSFSSPFLSSQSAWFQGWSALRGSSRFLNLYVQLVNGYTQVITQLETLGTSLVAAWRGFGRLSSGATPAWEDTVYSSWPKPEGPRHELS